MTRPRLEKLEARGPISMQATVGSGTLKQRRFLGRCATQTICPEEGRNRFGLVSGVLKELPCRPKGGRIIRIQFAGLSELGLRFSVSMRLYEH
jgi:hypothetical protein